jgi:IS6 family transposase
MTDARAFRGFRSPAEGILWAVRRCLSFPISYRDLERMFAGRGVEVDHVSLYRWVQRFAPELEKRLPRHPRPCRGPCAARRRDLPAGRGGQWCYLHRAIGGSGRTIGFPLGAEPQAPGGSPRRPTRNRHPIAPVPEGALNRKAGHRKRRI